MKNLKEQLIRLGHQNPELKKHLRPVLDTIKTSSSEVLVDVSQKDDTISFYLSKPVHIPTSPSAFDKLHREVEEIRRVAHKLAEKGMDKLGKKSRMDETLFESSSGLELRMTFSITAVGRQSMHLLQTATFDQVIERMIIDSGGTPRMML